MIQTPERDFSIKVSGLEIYNENVRDLLNSESGRNLKLLDDPEVLKPGHSSFFRVAFYRSEHSFLTHLLSLLHLINTQKGTVVEKLVEETVNDDQHLQQLIGICEGSLLKPLV